jgi:uncharacterized membrane protein
MEIMGMEDFLIIPFNYLKVSSRLLQYINKLTKKSLITMYEAFCIAVAFINDRYWMFLLQCSR